MRCLWLKLLAVVVSCLVLGVSPADARAEDSDSATEPGRLDDSVVFALDAAGLWEQWFDLTTMTPTAAVLGVDETAEIRQRRKDLVAAAVEMAIVESHERQLDSDLEALGEAAELVDAIARTVRADETRGLLMEPVERLGWVKEMERVERLAGDLEHLDPAHGVGQIASALGHRLVSQVGDDRGPVAAEKREPLPSWTPLLERIETARSEIDYQRLVAAVPSPDEVAVREAAEERIRDLHLERSLTRTELGTSLVTIDGYLAAEHFVPAGCSTVDWALLAGIGRVESIHGTLGGATVGPDGIASPSIRGPLLDGGATEREAVLAARAEEEAAQREIEAAIAEQEALDRRMEELVWGPRLEEDDTAGGDESYEVDDADDLDAEAESGEDDLDGGNGFAVIPDSDDGALDGNRQWDRAVGPMQFLPETWSLWGTDGDGDGVSSPHDIHDATASAARYLCYLEGRFGPDPTRYVLGYNDSRAYVDLVLSWADRYREIGI